MTSPSVSKYIAKAATTGQNHQKLLGYYGELYEFYNDKKPDNDYIYYLDENPYSEPAQTTNQDVLKFFSASPAPIGFTYPLYKNMENLQNKDQQKNGLNFLLRIEPILKALRIPTHILGKIVPS